MDFKHWLVESSLNDLYDSAVDAFPYTLKRQHAIQPVRITNIHWTAHPKFRTLYVRGLAESDGHVYNPTILFKGVRYHEHIATDRLLLTTTNGNKYFIEHLDHQHTQVQVRCNCNDFGFRFRYYNFLDHSLFGPKGHKYEAKGVRPPANPQEAEGVCKHLIKLTKVLQQSNLLK